MARSVKGIYRAFDFAFGVNPDAGGALQVVGGGGAASSTYSIICSPTGGESSDGKPCAISTNTPITIGGDSGLETVTPTSVSLNGLGQVVITAAFTFAHGVGAQVRSGSYGLGEAVAYVNSKGGGVIAIDADWKNAGGVAATITGLTGFINTPILDARGTATGTAFSYAAASNGAHYAVTAISWY
jgi:hypothetical protein